MVLPPAEAITKGKVIAIPDGSMVLTAALNGRTVWYTIQLSDGTEVRTTRFSELYDFHQRMSAEVPSFPGCLPSKTCRLKRHTSAAFVENRRRDIELYLRLVATHRVASQSTAWQAFMGGNRERAFASCPSELQQESASCQSYLQQESEELQDDFTYDSINSDMRGKLAAVKCELTGAQKAKQELEGSLCSVDQLVKAIDTSAQDRAALEAKAASRLRNHLLSLEELDTKLAANNIWRGTEECRLNELVKCFQRNLPLVSDSAQKAQASLEASRHAKRESAAKSKSKVAAAMAEQVAAETANEAARERHAVMNAAMGVLQQRAKACMKDFKAAEREVDILKLSQQALADESSEAESLRVAAEAAAEAAAAAVTLHISESVRRSRACEVDVRRAWEWASDLATLRDMKTRGLLKEDDRSSCKPIERTAAVAAETAVEALAKAKRFRDETKTADEQHFAVLQAVTAKARKHLRYRESLAAVLATRMEDVEAALNKASAKHAALGGGHTAVQEELESLKLRVEGSLAEALPVCAGRLQEAEEAVAAAKREGEQEQTSLRYAEEAEAHLLQKHQAEEASLTHEFEKAKMAAAEAQEGIALRSEARHPNHSSAGDTWTYQFDLTSVLEAEGARNKIDQLVKLCEAQCVGRDRDAKEAAEGHERAKEATGFARNIITRLYLERVVQEQKRLSDAADAAVAAGKEELAALQAQQRCTPVPGWYTKRLVREELAIITAELQNHKNNENAILSDAEQKKVEWVRQRATLAADIRHAELEVAVAKQNVQATQDWRRMRV